MEKFFYLTLSLLLLMVIMVVIHYTLSDREVIIESINTVSGLTHMASPSFGVDYWEPRMMGVEKASNIAYPEMIPINQMDFVYVW